MMKPRFPVGLILMRTVHSSRRLGKLLSRRELPQGKEALQVGPSVVPFSLCFVGTRLPLTTAHVLHRAHVMR